MKRTFYYAELDLTVDIVDGKDDLLKTFSTYEVQALSMMFHSVIADFMVIRALFSADAAEYAKRLENCRPKHTDTENGG